jgi:hypothetical protein
MSEAGWVKGEEGAQAETLAMALLGSPRVVQLDEPTSGACACLHPPPPTPFAHAPHPFPSPLPNSCSILLERCWQSRSLCSPICQQQGLMKGPPILHLPTCLGPKNIEVFVILSYITLG